MKTHALCSLTFSLLSCLASGAFAASSPAPVKTYPSEDQAKVQCPYDSIVWLNPRTHLWYTRASKHYANDRWGGFACKGDVVKAGNKPGRAVDTRAISRQHAHTVTYFGFLDSSPVALPGPVTLGAT